MPRAWSASRAGSCSRTSRRSTGTACCRRTSPGVFGRAGLDIGWDRYVGRTGAAIGMHTFGASAPDGCADDRSSAFTPDAVAKAAREQAAEHPKDEFRHGHSDQAWRAGRRQPSQATSGAWPVAVAGLHPPQFHCRWQPCQKLVEADGLGGVTSNPSIFEKAMGSGTDYDAEFKELAAGGLHDARRFVRDDGGGRHPAVPPTCCVRCSSVRAGWTGLSAWRFRLTWRCARKKRLPRRVVCRNGWTALT